MNTLPRVYPTDLTMTEWTQLKSFFSPASRRGRPRKWELWQILNAILYVTRTGCQWRMLPCNFPPWVT
ncbi:MAG: transposase, partial [Deltaproteobacteria bacterium]|nr:transposase [Deltaproteobacteria bacterium]